MLPIPTRWIHDGWIAILISAVADVLPINKPLIKYRQHDCQQIGAKSRGTIQQLARTLASSNLQRYIQAYEQYIEVSKRLDAAGLSPFDASLLREKIDHMNRRSALRKSRLSRMPTIAEELLSLRYRRFGYGMRSAARDLLVNLDGEPEQQLASL